MQRSLCCGPTPFFRLLLLTAAFVETTGLPTFTKSKISFKNNGYENILMAIDKSVSWRNHTKFLTEIQRIFDDASTLLFKLTRRTAYFRSVKVLLPDSWRYLCNTNLPGHLKCEQAARETRQTANIVMSVNTSKTPGLTLQPRGCGKSGELILLDETLADVTARPLRDAILIHEWAHLRWGLFDEGHNSSSRQCPKQGSNSSTSIMFSIGNQSTVEFCDKKSLDIQGSVLHNPVAINRQNTICNNKSAWEVMREHSDFIDSRPISTNVTINTAVNITYLFESTEKRVVIVMDTSGSMVLNDNIEKLSKAVQHYIRNIATLGSWLGLVVFHTDAEILAPLTLVTESSRETLAELVDLDLGDDTCIGCGMSLALQMLTGKWKDARGSQMLVVTDGHETHHPYIKDVLPELKDHGIILDTVLITSGGSEELGISAMESGGLSFLYTGHEATLGNLFEETLHSRTTSTNQNYPVFSDSITAGESETQCQRVRIEDALGANTVFQYTHVHGQRSSLNVTIWDPNNTMVHSGGFVNDPFQTFRLNCTTAGWWRICINNGGQDRATTFFQVKSNVRPNNTRRVVSLDVALSCAICNASGKGIEAPAVYGILRTDFEPVKNASVTAYVDSSSGPANGTSYKLLDDGRGADIIANDGIYSGYLNFRSNGLHSLTVKVLGWNAHVEVNGIGSSGAPYDGEEIPAVEEVPIPPFQRVASGGIIKVTNANTMADVISPGEVRDLRISGTDGDDNIIFIEFTAVGDDYEEGRAHHYIVKYSSSAAFTLNHFDDSTLAEVVYGNLTSPVNAGSQERFGIQAQEGQRYCIALQVWDEADNVSPVSNAVCGSVSSSATTTSHPIFPDASNVNSWSTRVSADIDLTRSGGWLQTATDDSVYSSSGVYRFVPLAQTLSVPDKKSTLVEDGSHTTAGGAIETVRDDKGLFNTAIAEGEYLTKGRVWSHSSDSLKAGDKWFELTASSIVIIASVTFACFVVAISLLVKLIVTRSKSKGFYELAPMVFAQDAAAFVSQASCA